MSEQYNEIFGGQGSGGSGGGPLIWNPQAQIGEYGYQVVEAGKKSGTGQYIITLSPTLYTIDQVNAGTANSHIAFVDDGVTGWVITSTSANQDKYTNPTSVADEAELNATFTPYEDYLEKYCFVLSTETYWTVKNNGVEFVWYNTGQSIIDSYSKIELDELLNLKKDKIIPLTNAGTFGSASKTIRQQVNAQGDITSILEQNIQIPSTQVTDFTEATQDAIGNALLDTNTIDLTYNGATNQISADVKNLSLDNSKIATNANIETPKIKQSIVSPYNAAIINNDSQETINNKAQGQINHLADLLNTRPIGASNGNIYYLTNQPSEVANYELISFSPDPSPLDIESVTINSTTTKEDRLIHSYISSYDIGGSVISGGIWAFNFYGYVSHLNSSRFEIDVYKRTGTVETLLFSCESTDLLQTSQVSPELNIANVETTQLDFACNSTDKIVIKVYAKTDRSQDTTITLLHSGTEYASHIHTPIQLTHNQLPEIQGGDATGKYHLTSNEYNKVYNLTTLGNDLVVITDINNDIKTSSITVDKLNALDNIEENIQSSLNSKEVLSNKVSAFSLTPNDTNYPTEKLVKDSLDAKLATSLKGAINGLAELGADGKVPASQLPSFVDDVLEYADVASFPTTGETNKIYLALDTNIMYRWSGTQYVEISSSLALGETSSTAYRGDRGKIAYDHSQTTGNPHNTTKADIGLGNVDNTSDLNKPISTATQTALNDKFSKTTNNEFNLLSAKTTVVDADVLPIEDSGASFSKKKSSLSTISSYVYSKASSKKIIYLSPTGLDTNSGFSQETAVLTLSQALILAGNSGNQIEVLPGTYAGDYTITQQNISIVGSNSETRGICNFTGTLTLNNTASSSQSLTGLSIANVVNTSVGGVYIENSSINTSFSNSGNGYIEIVNCDLGTSAINITGSGTKMFRYCNGGIYTINNSGATVEIENGGSIISPKLISGILIVSNTKIFSTSTVTNAIEINSGSILYLANVACKNPDTTNAKVSYSAGSFYSHMGVDLDSQSSIISGTNLNREFNFDNIRTNSINGINNTVLQYISTLSSDAQTQLNNKQALNSNLDGLSSLDLTTGFISQTASATFAKRVLNGANGITVVNGSGSDANPVITPTYGNSANTFAQGNDARLGTIDIDETNMVNGKALVYNSETNKIEYQTISQDLSDYLTKADNLESVADKAVALRNLTQTSSTHADKWAKFDANGNLVPTAPPSGTGNVSSTSITSATGQLAIFKNDTGTELDKVSNLTLLQRQANARSMGIAASFTSTEVVALNNWVAGDRIYNSSVNLCLVYTSAGTWVDAHARIGNYSRSVSNEGYGWLLCNGQEVSRTTYAGAFIKLGTVFGSGDGSTTFNLQDLQGRTSINIGQGTQVYSVPFTSIASSGTITVSSTQSLYNGATVVFTTTGTAPTGLVSGSTYWVTVVSETTIRLSNSLSTYHASIYTVSSQGTGTHTFTLSLTNRVLGDRIGEETHINTVLEMAPHLHGINGDSGSGVGGSSSSDRVLRNTDGNQRNVSSGRNTNVSGGGQAHNNMQPSLADGSTYIFVGV